ncbi:putative manganese transporter [Olsenella sp. Marseille-P4559]|uniref:putative manganese transporter n=1 Tax=Olsenella sp. Marseille-P4559 TaxID=2364795 RepID=UPI001A91FE2B|nr:putative manganese transporter [Olsenella sp. Marseille-P4559]
MDIFVDVIIESVLDTLELVPFLFVTYVDMEALEHSAEGRMQGLVTRAGHAGPVAGSLLGAIPQCGFSAMAATLFSGGVVTAGTLVAVILSTSDEMVPVFLAHQEPVGRLLSIVLLKVIVGLVVGLLLDAVMRAVRHVGNPEPRIHELCERAHCHCDDDGGEESDAVEEARQGSGEVRGCHHHHGYGRWGIVRSAAIHTVQVTGFILLITFLFGLLIEVMGEDVLARLLGSHPVRATLLAALVGLIPNCGASVAITELYLDGVLSAGPMVAGLLASGGVGLLVLFRTNDHLRQNVAITAFVYAVGVVVGLIVSASGILF